MNLPPIDPERLEEERAANREVLDGLASGGDTPGIVRQVDISFTGSEDALDRLEEAAGELGLTVLDREEEEGEIFLFLAREQKADEASVDELTLLCLQIEQLYDVEFDGWGCTAEPGAV